jgi:hypothetical protein
MHYLFLSHGSNGYKTRINVSLTLSLPFLYYRNMPIKNKRVPDAVFAESTDVESNTISGIDGS